MKLLFKVFLLSRPKEQGFVLPIIIALGLIMTLVGTISIFQSSDEQLTASSQRATSKALAAAEIGVAHYRELIDKNKIIATYPACETGTWTNADCDDDSTKTSWEQASNINNINDSCLANSSGIEAEATRAWQDITAGSPEDGQYRLIDYQYTSNYDDGSTPADPADDRYTDQPIGTLVVEGRVNQSNSNLANEPQAAIAKVEVNLPIQPGIPTGIPPYNGKNIEFIELEGNFNNLHPALWLMGSTNGAIDASVTNVSGLKVDGNIIVTDTDCTINSTIPTTANLKDPAPAGNQSVLISPIRPGDDSLSTKIYKYPRVYVNGTEEIDTDWDKDVNNDLTDDINLLSGGINAPIDLPQPGHLSETRPDGSVYYHYVVDGNINLNNADINISAGRKVILYVKGNITLTADGSGNSVNINSRNNGNKSYNLEIYGTDQTNQIIFKGGAGEINIKALIYAPNAQVEVQANPTVVIDGAVWVRDWKGKTGLTKDVEIRPDDLGNPTLISQQYFNYTYVKNDLVNLGVRLVDPIISAPSSWETLQAE